MFRSGQYGELPLPSIPGGDGAGRVVAVGEDVDAFGTSDRVFASGMDRAKGGTFAEYAAIPAEKLAHLPNDVSWTVGGAIGNVGATARTALEELAGVQAGDHVLVHGGSGGVGHAAVQIATHSGAEVITTAGTEDARRRLEELGATVALDYKSDSLAEDILAATEGAGVETVLDDRLDEYLDLDLEVAVTTGCEYVHPNAWLCLFTGIVGDAHDAGLEVNAWTVDSRVGAWALAHRGVDGLIASSPDVTRWIS